MYSKIAVGNVKKSFKDYAIYFLTLTLAVCIFYSFNSIESQKAVLEMNQAGTNYISIINKVIAYISVFVSVILGGLILYANNFLIKKRKKELGIYMTLGMGKSKISHILMMETFIVGVISLISGLLLGLLASQGLSLFTAKLFDVGMGEYKFLISTSAISKTILYFGIIFLLVMLFNTVVISKYKVIDLLTAGKKNEDIKIKNPLVYLLTFSGCVVSLGYAYKIIIEVGLDINNPLFLVSILLGIIGTVLFFFSLAGLLLFIIKRNKKIYFKGLNIFITKQINSKVNTNFISMSVICLMIFITLGVLSNGISFKNALEAGVEETTPFDASATRYVNEDEKVETIEEAFENIGFKLDDGEEYVYYNEYFVGAKIKNIINNDNFSKQGEGLRNITDIDVCSIKITDYNKIRKLDNKKEINLKKNEVIILSNFDEMVSIVNNFLEDNNKISIKGKEYIVKNNEVIEDVIRSSGFNDNMFTLVVNDEVTNSFKITVSYLNVNYLEKNKEKSEAKFSKLFNDFIDGNVDYKKAGFIIGNTKQKIYAENKGMTTIVLFIGIYLGIIFLIASMAVLALQQLSEASDSIERYKSLKRIGASEQSINKTIFKQIFVYFSLPIILAFIHSIVGMQVANDFIAMFNKPDMGGASLVTALIFMLVYVGYFYATYVGYKNIVKNSQ